MAAFVGSATVSHRIRLAWRKQARHRADLSLFCGIIQQSRRANPPAPEDVTVLDHMMPAEEDGDTLSLAELISNAVLLLLAGHETTTNLLGNGLIALLRNPTQFKLFSERPDLAEHAFEEILRYDVDQWARWLGACWKTWRSTAKPSSAVSRFSAW